MQMIPNFKMVVIQRATPAAIGACGSRARRGPLSI